MQIFISYTVSAKAAVGEAKDPTAVLTPQPNGTVQVLRVPKEGEKYSVKSVISLANDRIVHYLYRKPTCPKPLSKEEVRRRATL